MGHPLKVDYINKKASVNHPAAFFTIGWMGSVPRPHPARIAGAIRKIDGLLCVAHIDIASFPADPYFYAH